MLPSSKIYSYIQRDPSPAKAISNGRLIGFAEKHNHNGLTATFTMHQLIQLCEAYGVPHVSRLNKTTIGQRLALAIASRRGMLAPSAVDSQQYTVVSSEMDAATGRVCLRLSSVSRQCSQISGTHTRFIENLVFFLSVISSA